MSNRTTPSCFVTPLCTMACVLMLLCVGRASAADAPIAPPAVGEEAPDFALASMEGPPVRLSSLTEQGPVVLIVLRGYPGYQCPLCSRQVGQFIAAAKSLRDAGASVMLVYPGPADGLKQHAQDFIKGKSLPEGYRLLLDPDYTFTDTYQIRWDAKNETAYPSTFVIGKDRKVLFSKVSRTHGDRASVDEVLQALPAAKP